MLIRSGNIRDQSEKFSEIAPNFGRFFTLPNFWGGPSTNCRGLRTLSPLPRGSSTEKVSWGYSH